MPCFFLFIAICVIIGVTVFASEKPKTYENTWGFGWTFWLAVTASLCNFVVILYLYYVAKDEKRETFPGKPAIRTRPPPTNNIPLVTVNTSPPVSATEYVTTAAPRIDSKDDSGSGSGGRPPSILASSRTSSKRRRGSVKFKTGSHSSVTKDEYSSSEGETGTETGTETATGTYYDDDDSSSYSSSSYTDSEASSHRSSQGFVWQHYIDTPNTPLRQ